MSPGVTLALFIFALIIILGVGAWIAGGDR